jgi:isoquinoline 1-oxidoreductase subunit beta
VQVLSTDNPPGGIGEVGLPSTGGAIGNAMAVLTGARLRSLPMNPERVLAALRSLS